MRVLLLSILALLCAHFAAAQGGSLTPPVGPPSPVYKTLDEVEPRTPLVLGAPGVSTDASYAFVITQPGSYYLTRNLVTSGTGGVQIASPSVRLDLNGFEISGDGTGLPGVHVALGSDHFALKDGTLRNFGSGLLVAFGESGTAKGGHVEKVVAVDSGVFGFLGGVATTFVDCQAYDSGFSGFQAQFNSTLVRCLTEGGDNGFTAAESVSFTDCAASNASTTGFAVSGACLLERCRANGIRGTSARAFQVAGSGTTLSQCTAFSCTAVDGFDAFGGTVLNDCTVSICSLTGAGFKLAEGSRAVDCTFIESTATNAFEVANGTVLTGCTVSMGTLTGTGFVMGSGSQAVQCTLTNSSGNQAFINENTSSGVQYSGCSVDGFTAQSSLFITGPGALVQNCTVSDSTSSVSILQLGAESRAVGCVFEDCESSSNIIATGNGSSVEECSIIGCTTVIAVAAGAGCTVRGCLVERATLTAGGAAYSLRSRSTIIDCQVYATTSNGSITGIEADLPHGQVIDCRVVDIQAEGACRGIFATSACLVRGCTVSDVVSIQSTATGYQAGARSVIEDCVAIDVSDVGFSINAEVQLFRCSTGGSSTAGFEVGSGNLLQDCNAYTSGSVGVGFRTSGNGNVIDKCRAFTPATVFAFVVNGTNNVLTRNIAYGPGPGYSVAGASGNQANTSANTASSNPWINFDF